MPVSTGSCVVTILIGQWLFTFYIIGFYGRLLLDQNLPGLNQVLPNGFVEGETFGNLSVVVHLILAIFISGLGPLQLIPWIRRNYSGFHRINGRIFVAAVSISSLAGLYMVWTKGVVGGTPQYVAISIDAILILLFATGTVTAARAKRLASHQRWALRLFVVSSAVWFYRIFLMLWMSIHGAPVGFDSKAFEGPFLTFLSFAQFALPLLVLEIYLLAVRRNSLLFSLGTSILMLFSTAVVGVGSIAAFVGLWLPRLA